MNKTLCAIIILCLLCGMFAFSTACTDVQTEYTVGGGSELCVGVIANVYADRDFEELREALVVLRSSGANVIIIADGLFSDGAYTADNLEKFREVFEDVNKYLPPMVILSEDANYRTDSTADTRRTAKRITRVAGILVGGSYTINGYPICCEAYTGGGAPFVTLIGSAVWTPTEKVTADVLNISTGALSLADEASFYEEREVMHIASAFSGHVTYNEAEYYNSIDTDECNLALVMQYSAEGVVCSRLNLADSSIAAPSRHISFPSVGDFTVRDYSQVTFGGDIAYIERDSHIILKFSTPTGSDTAVYAYRLIIEEFISLEPDSARTFRFYGDFWSGETSDYAYVVFPTDVEAAMYNAKLYAEDCFGHVSTSHISFTISPASITPTGHDTIDVDMNAIWDSMLTEYPEFDFDEHIGD